MVLDDAHRVGHSSACCWGNRNSLSYGEEGVGFFWGGQDWNSSGYFPSTENFACFQSILPHIQDYAKRKSANEFWLLQESNSVSPVLAGPSSLPLSFWTSSRTPRPMLTSRVSTLPTSLFPTSRSTRPQSRGEGHTVHTVE